MVNTMAVNREWLDRLIVLSLCSMIFTLPFSKSAVEICIITAFVLWILKRSLSYDPKVPLIRIFKPPSSKLNLPIYLFIFAGFLSVVASASVSLSLKGIFSKLLKEVILYFLVIETINNRKRLHFVLIFMVLSMLLIGADGIFQFSTYRDFLRGYLQEGRITASFNTANGLGGWITVMLPLALGMIFTGKAPRPKQAFKFILFFLSCVLLFCLVMTRSRGAWVGSAFAMIFFIVCKKNRVFFIGMAIMSVLCIFFLAYLVCAHPGFTELLRESVSFSANDGHLSFVRDFFISVKNYAVQIMLKTDIVRTHLWREALSVIKDFPVFGCGLNTYSIVAPGYKGDIGGEAGFYPHNSYLQMAAETGIVGLASFLIVVISLFRVSIKNLQKIKEAFYNSILIGLLAGLFGFLVHSFFDVNLYALQLVNLMWFVMGLIIAVQRIALKEESKSLGYNA